MVVTRRLDVQRATTNHHYSICEHKTLKLVSHKRCRIQVSSVKAHRTQFAGRGYNSVTHHNLAHKPILVLRQ